jgi:hypothetical protein
MDRLLKPGGRLIHAIDVGFPSNFGVGRLALHLAARAASRRLGRRWPARLAGPCDKEFAFARTHGAGMVLAGIGLDAVGWLLPRSIRAALAPTTPRAYVRMVFDALRVRASTAGHGLGVLNLVLNPRVVTTSYDEWFHLFQDGESGVRSPRRMAGLLIHLRKAEESGSAR